MDGKARVIFVLGGPGVGKGTQCQKIQQQNEEFVHLSAGELLRQARESGSEHGEVIMQCINQGTIVPAEITVDLLRQAMVAHGWEKKRFLVDGFPRNEDNYQKWYDMMEAVEVEYCVFMDCDVDAMAERIKARGSARSDDNPEVFKKRITTYNEQTKPIIDRFSDLGRLRRVDGNLDVDSVYEQMLNILKD